MDFVYKPEGVEPRKWPFEPGRLLSPEVTLIEKRTGMSYAEWVTGIKRQSVLAVHGFLYVMLKRANPSLQWDQVVFCMDEIDFEVGDEEAAELRAGLEAKAERTPEEDEALAALIASGAGVPEEKGQGKA